MYVGNRHSRVRGERYDRLIAAYIETASRLFPNALLHFEDFGPSNARRILEEYRDKARIFNDDMQGTGAITLAAILAGLRVTGTRPSEQRVVIFGAGTAGVGIADQIRAVMVRDGLSQDEATRRFWCVDKQGLLVDDMDNLRGFQRDYARTRSEVADWGDDGTIDLLEVVQKVHPTIIVGTSTTARAFTEQVIRAMAKGVERPLIFPLSNPTELIEAAPADVIKLDRRPRPGRDRNTLGAGALQGDRLLHRAGQQRAYLPGHRAGDGRLARRARDRRDAARRLRGHRRTGRRQPAGRRASA